MLGLTDESENHGGRDVGDEYDDKASHYRQGNGPLWVVCLLSRRGDNVESDEGIEAGRRPGQYLHKSSQCAQNTIL
jgi:hypothetical protein